MTSWKQTAALLSCITRSSNELIRIVIYSMNSYIATSETNLILLAQ